MELYLESEPEAVSLITARVEAGRGLGESINTALCNLKRNIEFQVSIIESRSVLDLLLLFTGRTIRRGGGQVSICNTTAAHGLRH